VGKIWAAGTERAHEALRGIDLTVDGGEFVVVLGPSGCGKSTLLYLMAGLEEASTGEITAHGVPVAGPAPDRSLIFQETSLFPWLSVWQNVSFGLSLRGLGKAEQQETARQVLLRTGLAEAFDKRPHELSGGMRQRVAVAPCARHAPEGVADGRAVCGARRADPGKDAGFPTRRLARERRLGHFRHPSHRRSDGTRRPGRRVHSPPRADQRYRCNRSAAPSRPVRAGSVSLRRNLTELLSAEVDRAFAEQESVATA
jgi:NitT/TauT family transport system ATP-binding protein